MNFYLQMGYGMQTLSFDLIKDWGNGNVILSPVNIEPKSLQLFSKKIVKAGGKVFFDPQMFYLENPNLHLLKYSYWPENINYQNLKSIFKQANEQILEINTKINSAAIILPGMELDENQMDLHIDNINNSAMYYKNKTNKPLFATLCLTSKFILNSSCMEKMQEELKKIPVDGFYLIPQTMDAKYLVTEPKWILSLLKLITFLKNLKKQVIVGYTNHQGLIYSLANVDGIAAGNFCNTRSFCPKKFHIVRKEIKRRSIWFYVPSALCEYNISSLQMAYHNDCLNKYKTKKDFENKYSSMLFNGALPLNTNFNNSNSFKHYLSCLKIQCEQFSQYSYRKTFIDYENKINQAEEKMKELVSFSGNKNNSRDFLPALITNRKAMLSFDAIQNMK